MLMSLVLWSSKHFLNLAGICHIYWKFFLFHKHSLTKPLNNNEKHLTGYLLKIIREEMLLLSWYFPSSWKCLRSFPFSPNLQLLTKGLVMACKPKTIKHSLFSSMTKANILSSFLISLSILFINFYEIYLNCYLIR